MLYLHDICYIGMVYIMSARYILYPHDIYYIRTICTISARYILYLHDIYYNDMIWCVILYFVMICLNRLYCQCCFLIFWSSGPHARSFFHRKMYFLIKMFFFMRNYLKQKAWFSNKNTTLDLPDNYKRVSPWKLCGLCSLCCKMMLLCLSYDKFSFQHRFIKYFMDDLSSIWMIYRPYGWYVMRPLARPLR